MTTPKIERVLVAIKPWARGLPLAAEHARFIAQSMNAEIALVCCVFESQVAFGLAREDRGAFAAQTGLIESEQAELGKLAQSLRDWGATVRTRVLWHLPYYEGILQAAREWNADLLVVGAHQPTIAPHTRLTDTDWQMMRLAPCPLLLVKDPGFTGYRTILATIDPLHRHAEPSGLDRAVLSLAREFSRAFGSQLVAAHAYPEPERFALASSVEVLPGVYYGTENMEALHREAVRELVGEYGITAAQTELRPGEPAVVIAEIIGERKAKLVVLGAVQRSRLGQALLGSTAETVAREVDCDVLLVKPPVPGRRP